MPTSSSSAHDINEEDLASLGPSWVLSYDKTSIWRSWVTKEWAAAMTFVNQVSQCVENNSCQDDKYHDVYPEVHLTNRSAVRIVLSSTQESIELAKTIDQLPIECCTTWLNNQPTTFDNIDSTSGSEEQTVSFDTSHYLNGLNGDFVQPDAITKFGGDDNTTSSNGTVGIFENPELRDIARAKHHIVKALRLSPGNIVADIGAGTGLLEPLLSEAVGPTGQILVSEISALFRQRLAERCQDLSNITVIDDPTDRDPKLPTGQIVDLALLVDVYHHLEYPQTVMRKVRDSLKDHTGALVVIDFHRDPIRITSHGEEWVYQHLRADQATFTQEIERTGFVQVEQVDVPGLPENYCLVFRKCPLRLSEPGVGWT